MAAPAVPRTYVIGTWPPPFGGVSVFVQRRVAQLRRGGHHPVVRDWQRLGPLARLGWLLEILLTPRTAVFELNGFETQAMIALLLRPFPKTLVYWVHSGQFTANLNPVQRWVMHRFLKWVDEVVFVSRHIPPMFEQNGFALPRRWRVQHAFLPPVLEDEARIWQGYDPATVRFVAAHAPLLVMQGSNAFHLGVDRYGTDLAAEMLHLLADRYPRMGLLVGRPTEGDAAFQAYFHDLQARIAAWGLHERVHFLTGERELWPLTRRATVFLRPSNQDGDSVAVREAMLFNVPVVASDACPRPDGVVTFRNRDAGDFAEKVEAVLRGWKPVSPPPATTPEVADKTP